MDFGDAAFMACVMPKDNIYARSVPHKDCKVITLAALVIRHLGGRLTFQVLRPALNIFYALLMKGVGGKPSPSRNIGVWPYRCVLLRTKFTASHIA